MLPYLSEFNAHWRWLRLKTYHWHSQWSDRWFFGISVEWDTAQSLIGCAHDMVNSMLCAFCLTDEVVTEIAPRISPAWMSGELAATNQRVLLSQLERNYAQFPHVRKCCVLDSSKWGHATSKTACFSNPWNTKERNGADVTSA